MKNLKNNWSILEKVTLLLFFSLLSVSLNAQTAGTAVHMEVKNMTQPTSTTWEFDVYLTNTGTTSLALRGYSLGMNHTIGINGAGTITTSYIANSRDPLLSTIPIPTGSYTAPNHIRMTTTTALVGDEVPMTPLIPYKLGRMRLTNSIAWVGSNVNPLLPTAPSTALQLLTAAGKTQCIATCYVNYPATNNYSLFGTGNSPTATSLNVLTGAVIPSPSGAAPFLLNICTPTTSTSTIVSCNSYTWSCNGSTYTAGGVYTCTSLNASGCLHTSTLNLTINANTSSTSSATACNTYTWSASGLTYTASGVYTKTSLNAAGCVHTQTLNLTINNSTTSTSTIVSCNSYTWSCNGSTYTASGVYTCTSLNASGCLHTSTLNLTINANTSTTNTAVSCDSYTWACNNTTYTASGIYVCTSLNASGCLHTQILSLTINVSTTNTTILPWCGPYVWATNGQTYTASGVYNAVSLNAAGCTHTETLNLTVLTNYNSYTNPIIVGQVPCKPSAYTNTQTNSTANCFTNNVPSNVAGATSPDIWYKFTLANTGKVTISTCSSLLSDTYLTLFANNGSTILEWVDDYDPNKGSVCTGTKASFSKILQAGTYYLVAQGYANAVGSITTTITTECYCNAIPTSNADEEIYRFVFNNGSTNSLYANINGCANVAPDPGSILGRYSGFKSLGNLTTVQKGGTYPFKLYENECDGFYFYTFGAAIWIDFNGNSTFEPSEKVYCTNSPNQYTSPAILTGNIFIPSTAMCGQTVMRVMVAEGINGCNINPCVSYGYGETEDFLINIGGPIPKFTLFPVLCPGSGNASFTLLNPTTGTSPFTYNITNGTGIYNNIPAPSSTTGVYPPGNYTITVTDATGCFSTKAVVIPISSDKIAPTWPAASVNAVFGPYTNALGTGCTKAVPIPAATDNCPGVTVTADPTVLTGNGLHKVTYTAKDASGNVSSVLIKYIRLNTTDNCCTKPPSEMVSWHPFDETSGSIGKDIIGGYHANLGSNIAKGVLAKVSNAISPPPMMNTNGADQVVVSNVPELNFGYKNMTIDAWVYPNADPVNGQATLIDKMLLGTGGYQIMFINGTLGVRLGANRTNFSPYLTNWLPLNVWTLITVTVTQTTNPANTTVKYIIKNVFGTTILSIPKPGNYNLSNPSSLLVGSSRTAGVENFNGKIDELEIFNRALTEDEINDIYNAGPMGKCKKTCKPGSDISMKDNNFDKGTEANNDNFSPWVSKDIWVRNQDDGLTTDAHQVPKYYTPAEVASGKINYVYVRVRNNGCNPTPGGELLKTYWTINNIAIWPQSWINFQAYTIGCSSRIMGDQINTGLVLPVLAPGETRIFKIQWNAPNPVGLSCLYGYNFGYLARIEGNISSPGDYIVSNANTPNVTNNVKNSNNIVHRRETYIYTYPYNTSVMLSLPSVSSFRVQVTNPVDVVSNDFFNYGHVRVSLDPDLFTSWVANGMQGSGFTLDTGNVIKLNSMNAYLEGIEGIPDEIQVTQVEFKQTIPIPAGIQHVFPLELSIYNQDTLIGGNRITVDLTCPNPVITGKSAICNGSPTTLKAIDLSQKAVSMQWKKNGVNIPGANADSLNVSTIGVYSISMTDAVGCVTIQTDTVVASPAINITSSITQPTCGSTNGTITLNATGGMGSFQYMLDTASSSVLLASNSLTGIGAGMYLFTVEDSVGCTKDITVNVANPCGTVLSIKAYIQGYYIGGGMMSSVLANQGQSAPGGHCDSIKIELRGAIAPFPSLTIAPTILHTDGTASANLSVAPGSYYIVIKHRNGLETWSANPVTIGVTPATYDFTSAASKAYGANQVEVAPSAWALFSGDVVQDLGESIDLADLAEIEAKAGQFSFGYQHTDINGDGNVDVLDIPLVEQNITNFIFVNHP